MTNLKPVASARCGYGGGKVCSLIIYTMKTLYDPEMQHIIGLRCESRGRLQSPSYSSSKFSVLGQTICYFRSNMHSDFVQKYCSPLPPIEKDPRTFASTGN